MNNRFIPCRVMDKKWVERFLDGEVFMRSLSEFGSWNLLSNVNDNNRRDVYEGVVETYANPDSHEFSKGLDETMKAHIMNVSFIDQSDLQYFKILCFYCLEINDNDSVEIPDSRIKGFGDTVIVFTNFNEFLARLGNTILTQYECSVELLNRINYYDLSRENRKLTPLFEKTKKYSFQKELRFAFCQTEKDRFYRGSNPDNAYRLIYNTDSVVLQLGNICDIAYAIPVDHFVSGKLSNCPYYLPATNNESLFCKLSDYTNNVMKEYKSIITKPTITLAF